MSISSSVTFSSSRSKLSMPYSFVRALVVMVILTSNFPQKSDALVKIFCVADPQLPECEIQKALDWACANGADCGPIQPNKSCYLPNTLNDHASYAFNSYYQRFKQKGGDCWFRAAGRVTERDPSHGKCKFEYIPFHET